MRGSILRSTLFGAVLTTLVAAPVLGGGQPTRAFAPIPSPIDLPAGVFCTFDVRVDILTNQEYAITFPADANGDVRQIITGRLIVSLTNVDSGASVVLNISGPGHLVYHSDGSLTDGFGGRSLPIQPGAALVLTSGRVIQEFAADGRSILGPVNGHSVDECVALS
jgi:hypothetical protein